jgi:hypothetical protein
MLPKITGPTAPKRSTTPTAPLAKTVSASNVAGTSKPVYSSGTPTNLGGYSSGVNPNPYVPGYGYVKPGPGTSGTVLPGDKPFDSGQDPNFKPNPPADDPKPKPDPNQGLIDSLRDLFSQPAALTPEQRQAELQMRREAERSYEAMLAQTQLQRQLARQDYRTGMRDTRRQAQGGAQDLQTAMAYLGLDTSPGVTDVGVEDINNRAKLAMSQLERSRAERMAEIQAMKTQGRIGRRQALTGADAFVASALANNTGLQAARLREILNGL